MEKEVRLNEKEGKMYAAALFRELMCVTIQRVDTQPLANVFIQKLFRIKKLKINLSNGALENRALFQKGKRLYHDYKRSYKPYVKLTQALWRPSRKLR